MTELLIVLLAVVLLWLAGIAAVLLIFRRGGWELELYDRENYARAHDKDIFR